MGTLFVLVFDVCDVSLAQVGCMSDGRIFFFVLIGVDVGFNWFVICKNYRFLGKY